MSEPAAFTPGPWTASKPSSAVGIAVQAPNGMIICGTNWVSRSAIDPEVPGDHAFRRECEANARLIAAAPELYAALEELLTVSGEFVSAERMKAAGTAARAALAKARKE